MAAAQKVIANPWRDTRAGGPRPQPQRAPASDQPVVTVNRRRYALNDTAKAAGFSEITPVLRRSPDPQLAALNVKAEIAPLRARALQLCTPAP
ncbi:MAG: hypothetical protein Q8L86_11235 [Vicinamibacterales bacterium]|nr:hypothetical protein [Vicinamibacterales bacterium]